MGNWGWVGASPFGPWQATRVSAFFAPACTSCACDHAGARSSRNKKAASRRPLPIKASSAAEREDEHAVATLEVYLSIAAAAHCDVLSFSDHVGHRLRVRAGAAVEAPQLLAGRRVERIEVAIALAEEEETARGGE